MPKRPLERQGGGEAVTCSARLDDAEPLSTQHNRSVRSGASRLFPEAAKFSGERIDAICEKNRILVLGGGECYLGAHADNADGGDSERILGPAGRDDSAPQKFSVRGDDYDPSARAVPTSIESRPEGAASASLVPARYLLGHPGTAGQQPQRDNKHSLPAPADSTPLHLAEILRRRPRPGCTISVGGPGSLSVDMLIMDLGREPWSCSERHTATTVERG